MTKNLLRSRFNLERKGKLRRTKEVLKVTYKIFKKNILIFATSSLMKLQTHFFSYHVYSFKYQRSKAVVLMCQI